MLSRLYSPSSIGIPAAWPASLGSLKRETVEASLARRSALPRGLRTGMTLPTACDGIGSVRRSPPPLRLSEEADDVDDRVERVGREERLVFGVRPARREAVGPEGGGHRRRRVHRRGVRPARV